MYKHFFKRVLDFIGALVGLILLSPVLVVAAVWLHFANKGAGAFFLQERPGLNEKIFKVVKFKTMTDERDENGKLLPDAQRLTKVGRFVRSTSIDELPQLINVLKGDMSFIGPRPLLVQYLSRYNEEQRHRHDVRPGLTGYAQAHGRNTVSWEDKFAMDVWYTRNVSFKTDIQIIFDTIRTVLKHEGITSSTSATMEEFMGTPEGVKPVWRSPR